MPVLLLVLLDHHRALRPRLRRRQVPDLGRDHPRDHLADRLLRPRRRRRALVPLVGAGPVDDV